MLIRLPDMKPECPGQDRKSANFLLARPASRCPSLISSLFSGLVLVCSLCVGAPAQSVDDPDRTFFADVWQDQVNFYSLESLADYAPAFGAGAIMANTDIDGNIRDWYQEDVRGSGSDDFAKTVKPFGDAKNTLPVFAAAWAIGALADDNATCDVVGQWGQMSTRAILVGFAPLLVLQRGLGASRPDDEKGSKWRPFDAPNAVSGHAFIGAVPFMTAARLSKPACVRYPLYAASAFCGVSRINDDKHFSSQVLMGWWLALVATDAVNRTRESDPGYRVEPVVMNGRPGIGIAVNF